MKTKQIILLSLLFMAGIALKAEVTVATLKTDYKINPLGMDNPVPRLSWILQSDQQNTLQESYEIRAALSEWELQEPWNLLWGTGKVAWCGTTPSN